MNTSTKTTTRWLAALAMAAGLGTAIVTGSAVATADTGTTANNDATSAPSPTTDPTNVAHGAYRPSLTPDINTKIFEITQDVTLCKSTSHCGKGPMDDYIRG